MKATENPIGDAAGKTVKKAASPETTVKAKKNPKT